MIRLVESVIGVVD